MNPFISSWPRLGALFVALTLSACAHQAPSVMQAPPAQAKAHPHAVVMTQQAQNALSADAALERLKAGNARFVAGQMLPRDLPQQVKISGNEGQYPFASIVSCIDSRSSPTLVFDQGVGDLFTAQVAGNVVNPDILGSLEYASKVAGTKLIVILGHTHCGGVKGACDDVQLGNLTQLLHKIRPAVLATSNVNGADRSSANDAFVDAVAANNVHLNVKAVTEQSPVLREMAEKGDIKIVGAMLDVETGKIVFN